MSSDRNGSCGYFNVHAKDCNREAFSSAGSTLANLRLMDCQMCNNCEKFLVIPLHEVLKLHLLRSATAALPSWRSFKRETSLLQAQQSLLHRVFG